MTTYQICYYLYDGNTNIVTRKNQTLKEVIAEATKYWTGCGWMIRDERGVYVANEWA